MHTLRHILALLAVLPLLGAGALCPCPPMMDEAAPAPQAAPMAEDHACCKDGEQDAPTTPPPAAPHDCDHCHLLDPGTPDPTPDTDLLTHGPSYDLHWALDTATPLPLSLVTPQTHWAPPDQAPAPSRADDTLLARGCMLLN